MGNGATCDYYFSTFHLNVYMFGPCMCSLDGSAGYCPAFNQTGMDAYMSVMNDYYNRGTFCASVDRYNIEAQSECGLGLMAPNDPLWAKAVNMSYWMETWPSNQGIIPGNCTEKFDRRSYTNINAHMKRI